MLIDADNASSSVIKEILEEAGKYGTPTVKRAFGDWTTPHLVGWKACLHQHAIQPIQQFAYTQGKNSTDSAFIIDAMDLLYAGNVEGFCLVSSDSDFTRLATRLREAGKVVYGLGERKTPDAFIAACDKFIFFEVLKKPAEMPEDQSPVPDVPDIRELMVHAVRETTRDNGWSRLATLGSFLGKTHTSFDSRNYGFKKLSDLVRNQRYLDVREDATAAPGSFQMEVRLKPK
ncbi:Maebl [plant metagenome]|uniref:Maebl n=1 Tax=plant metagenome TaxID=1297885 RepID=A0A484R4P9_9ZZZZ